MSGNNCENCKFGPVYLDGAQYGQRPGEDIEPDQLERMMADGRLIVAAPDLLEALEFWISYKGDELDAEFKPICRAAIAKVRGDG